MGGNEPKTGRVWCFLGFFSKIGWVFHPPPPHPGCWWRQVSNATGETPIDGKLSGKREKKKINQKGRENFWRGKKPQKSEIWERRAAPASPKPLGLNPKGEGASRTAQSRGSGGCGRSIFWAAAE